MSDPNLGTLGQVDPASRVAPLQALKGPDPVVELEDTKWYYCDIAHAKFHRFDGTPLPFVNHIFDTKIEASQQYLDNEIKLGNPVLRVATAEEVRAIKLHRNPTATIRQELMDELEPKLREELTAKILEELSGGESDAGKIAGTDDIKSRIEAIRAGKTNGVVKTGSATMVPLTSEGAPLRGIVGTDSIAKAAAS